MKVLLVEDDEATIAVMSRRLKSVGCEVVVATTTGEALRLAADEQPAWILVDLGLEGGPRSGVQLLSALGAAPATTSIPRYIHSAYMDTPEDMPATQSLASGVLMKPASRQDLEAIVVAVKRA